jgi:hypothetical protein
MVAWCDLFPDGPESTGAPANFTLSSLAIGGKDLFGTSHSSAGTRSLGFSRVLPATPLRPAQRRQSTNPVAGPSLFRVNTAQRIGTSTDQRYANLHRFRLSQSVPNQIKAGAEIANDFLISIFGKTLILLRCGRPVTPEVAGSSPVSLAIFLPPSIPESARLRRLAARVRRLESFPFRDRLAPNNAKRHIPTPRPLLLSRKTQCLSNRSLSPCMLRCTAIRVSGRGTSAARGVAAQSTN